MLLPLPPALPAKYEISASSCLTPIGSNRNTHGDDQLSETPLERRDTMKNKTLYNGLTGGEEALLREAAEAQRAEDELYARRSAGFLRFHQPATR